MNEAIISRTLLATLSRGKYSDWAPGLDADTLEALLWLIGEFGSRFAVTRLPDGSFPAPRFHRHSGMSAPRMRNALETLATIHSAGRTEWRMPSGWDRDLAVGEPVFARQYQERLSHGAQTAWAKDLDERSLGLCLWMVGEYGIRAISSCGPDGGEYPPPEFQGDPGLTRPMRAALRLIVKIFSNERITCAGLSRRVAEETV